MQAALTPTLPPHTQQRILQMWAVVQRELIFINWAIMEVALLVPFSLAIMRWARFWPPNIVLVWLLALMLLPFNMVRLMAALQLPGVRQQQIIGVTLIGINLYAISTLIYNGSGLFDFSWLPVFYANLAETRNILWLRDLSLFFLITLTWWRGLRLSQRVFTVNSVGLRLRLGGLLLAPVIIWLGSARLIWNVTPYLLLFFLAALTVLSLIRADELERDRSGKSTSLSPRWLGMIFVASFFCIFTATAVTILISGESAFLISGWLAPLWLAISFTVTVVTAAFAYVAFPFFLVIGSFIEWFSAILAAALAANPFRGLTLPTRQPLPEESLTVTPIADATGIFTLSDGVKIGVILLMILVVVLVTFALSRLYAAAQLAEQEGHTMTTTPDSDQQKPGLARRLLQRLGLLRNWRMAASIRRIYQQMTKTAAAVGYPRLASETPYEYLQTLTKAWPDHLAETRLITEAYINIRYGELPETRAELNEIIAAWERLEAIRPLHAATPSS